MSKKQKKEVEVKPNKMIKLELKKGVVIDDLFDDYDLPKKKKKKAKKKKIEDVIIYTKKTLKKILKGMKPNYHAQFFQDERFYNLILCNDDGDIIKRYKSFVSKKQIKTLSRKYPDAQVMVGVSQGYFKLLPIETLSKLSKISKLVITSTLIAFPDGDEDPFDVHEIVENVTTISELLKHLLTASINIDTVKDIVTKDYWYWAFELISTATIELNNGDVIYYSDISGKPFSEFLSDFGLSMYLA